MATPRPSIAGPYPCPAESRETIIGNATGPDSDVATNAAGRSTMGIDGKSPATFAQRVRVRTDSPLVVAAVSVVAAIVFVLLRLAIATHGNISFFIVAGITHSTPRLMNPRIIVVPNSGYDGQFYYRMALDPADMARSAFGVTLDSVSRLQRIAYPAIAWLLAAGRPSLVPDALVITNVIGLGVVGFGGGLMARDSGRHALWGLVLAGYWGYLWSAGRDLTEITAAAFLVLGLYAYRKERWALASVLLLGAVLAKETSAYIVLVIAATRLVGWAVRRQRRPIALEDAAWIVPLVGFASWQAVVYSVTGHTPLLSSGEANLGPPFTGVIDGFRFHFEAIPSRASFIWFGELVVLIILIVAAAVSVRRSSIPIHEQLAWVAVVVLAISTARGIWLGDVGFRSLDDVYLFSWLVLLGSSRKLGYLGGLVGLVWLGVAVELIRYV
jgi:hypothetical protein